MLNVAVLYGGASVEHEVSVASAETVVAALSPTKYNIIPVYITREGRWLLNDMGGACLASPLLERVATPCFIVPELGLVRISSSGRLRQIPVDVVFPVLHGRMGEDGSIQSLCELAGLPYVGSGIGASAAGMDKSFAKAIAQSLGMPCPPHLVHHGAEPIDTQKIDESLSYPIFVKPANCGSSKGITKVHSKDELEDAISEALQHDTKVMIEQAISGRELECSVLGSGYEDTVVSGVGEIIPADEFYSYDAKYNNKASQTLIPADIPQEITELVQELSLRIFCGIGASGMARIDFFYNEQAGIFFNEINTIPGWTNISMYPMLLNASDIPNSTIVDTLITLALQ